MSPIRLIAPLLLSTVLIVPALGSPPQRPTQFLSSFRMPSPDQIRHWQRFARPAPPDTGTYTIINAPDAGTGWGQGTFAWGVNLAGDSVGWYVDPTGYTHGFLRAADGTFTGIDVAGGQTVAYGIDGNGAIVGGYVDRHTGRCPAFLRTSAGHVKKFDPPDDGGVWPYNCVVDGPINKSATTAGLYYGTDGTYHSFLRMKNGTITEFDPPNATFSGAYGINDGGTISGQVSDSTGDHGYIRAADGSFTVFDPPGSVETIVVPINKHGAVEGDYLDSSDIFHAFVRNSDGTFVEYDAPDAGTGARQGTGGEGGIDDAGDSAGAYVDANDAPHGYIRSSNGTIVEFDPPGAIATYIFGLNNNGVASGFYVDTYGVFHGFLRTP